jgi:hypothetical protein
VAWCVYPGLDNHAWYVTCTITWIQTPFSTPHNNLQILDFIDEDTLQAAIVYLQTHPGMHNRVFFQSKSHVEHRLARQLHERRGSQAMRGTVGHLARRCLCEQLCLTSLATAQL